MASVDAKLSSFFKSLDAEVSEIQKDVTYKAASVPVSTRSPV